MKGLTKATKGLTKATNALLTRVANWRMVGVGREAYTATTLRANWMSADILDELAGAVEAEIASRPEGQAIQKVNYSHDGMINLIICHRGITQNQIAQHFGYSASWVSQVMSSDAFQARLAERAAEIEDPTIRATVEEGLKGLIARSVEIIKEKLKGEPSAIPDNLAIRTLELSTRALGMGAKAPTVIVNNNQVENHLEVLGGRLTNLLTRKRSETATVPMAPGPDCVITEPPLLEQSNG